MTLFVSFFLLCLLITPSLWAQNSYSEFERGLALSEPQRTQVEGIRNRYVNEWQVLRTETARKRMELRELNRFYHIRICAQFITFIHIFCLA